MNPSLIYSDIFLQMSTWVIFAYLLDNVLIRQCVDIFCVYRRGGQPAMPPRIPDRPYVPNRPWAVITENLPPPSTSTLFMDECSQSKWLGLNKYPIFQNSCIKMDFGEILPIPERVMRSRCHPSLAECWSDVLRYRPSTSQQTRHIETMLV